MIQIYMFSKSECERLYSIYESNLPLFSLKIHIFLNLNFIGIWNTVQEFNDSMAFQYIGETKYIQTNALQ